jgi:hypothetical protein
MIYVLFCISDYDGLNLTNVDDHLIVLHLILIMLSNINQILSLMQPMNFLNYRECI